MLLGGKHSLALARPAVPDWIGDVPALLAVFPYVNPPAAFVTATLVLFSHRQDNSFAIVLTSATPSGHLRRPLRGFSSTVWSQRLDTGMERRLMEDKTPTPPKNFFHLRVGKSEAVQKPIGVKKSSHDKRILSSQPTSFYATRFSPTSHIFYSVLSTIDDD